MTSRKPPTIVQISLLDESGDSYHRMRWPAQAVSLQSPELCVINLDFRSKQRFEWGIAADLLVILHCGDLDLLPLIQERRELGKKTLVEINDNFYSPQKWNPARLRWESPDVWKAYEEFMSTSDGVIVTGRGLFDLLQDKAKTKIHILENHFPFPMRNFEEIYRPSESRVALGWAGSSGHMADLLFVLPELRALLEKYENLDLHIMCDASTPSFLNLPSSRLKFTPFGPIQNYFEFWKNIDLAFVPLLDTPYNRCRSDIKPIEISGFGVLPILQNTFPYQTFISKTDAPHFATPREFFEKASALIESYEKRNAGAKQCFEYIQAERQILLRRERLELYLSLMTMGTNLESNIDLPAGYHEVAKNLDNQMKWALPVAKPKISSEAERRYILAKQAFRNGNSQIAFENAEWLLERKNLLAENKSFFEEVPDYVLEIWIAAMEARLASNLPDPFSSWE